MNINPSAITYGIYLPEQVLTNEDIERQHIVFPSGKLLTAEQIQAKIGVERRHIASKDETVADMGYQAAKNLVTNPDDIAFLAVSTSHPTPYHVASEIQKRLQIQHAEALDFHTACTGTARIFAYLHEHRQRLAGKKVLVVAAEKFSPTVVSLTRPDAMTLDHSLGQTIFGDGAAAMRFIVGQDIITHAEITKALPNPQGKTDLICMAMGENTFVEPSITYHVVRSPYNKDFPEGYFTQDGPGVFGTIRTMMPDIIRETVHNAGFIATDIDLVIIHPGSKRMVDTLQEALPEFQVYSDYADGNMSSVSLLYSFIKALREERIGKGGKVILSGFGAGSPHLYSSTVAIELG